MNVLSVEQEAIRLRQEHADIAARLSAKRAIARERFTNESALRGAAGWLVGILVPQPYSFGAAMRTVVGPKTSYDIWKLEGALDANSDAAQTHYTTHADAYHKMAIDDAPEHVEPVNFSGDVANGVHEDTWYTKLQRNLRSELLLPVTTKTHTFEDTGTRAASTIFDDGTTTAEIAFGSDERHFVVTSPDHIAVARPDDGRYPYSEKVARYTIGYLNEHGELPEL